MNARKQYLEEVGKEYSRADETGRGRLLDEAEKRTGLNRKYLIRVLNHPLRPRGRKRRRRRAEYGAAVVTALVEVWDIFEQPCGQRMVAVLRSELDRLRRLGELRCGDAVAGQQVPENEREGGGAPNLTSLTPTIRASHRTS
jgi:hypothetical protein